MDALTEDFASITVNTAFLAEMVPGGKPYTDVLGNISVGSPGMFQGVTRYVRGESRVYTEEYASYAVCSISQFLERFMEHVRWNSVSEMTHALYSDVGDHLERCIEGLNMLYATYDNGETFKSLRSKLTSSISLFKAGCKRYGALTSTVYPTQA